MEVIDTKSLYALSFVKKGQSIHHIMQEILFIALLKLTSMQILLTCKLKR